MWCTAEYGLKIKQNISVTMYIQYTHIIMHVSICVHMWFALVVGPPVVHDWVIKGLGMFSRVCATGHIKDAVTLTEKTRASCPSGKFPPSFIHQVIIITGLNRLSLYVLHLHSNSKLACGSSGRLRPMTRAIAFSASQYFIEGL